jgi:phenylalanyl-tRNA synthetase beta chain
MKVSLNLVKKYTDINVSVDELIELIGSKLGAIEEVIYLGQKYDGAIIVKVVECDKHPDADKLSVCKIDDGNVIEGVQRDNQGLIQVVCGAPNVRKDMLAVWLRPGTVVPSTAEKDPITLEAKDLRGIVSQGMLASSKELGLNDDHNGLLELDKPANVGQKFSDLYELDDVIIDIENKMFTHRPDCFGVLGVAREIAGITETSFKSPDWYLSQYDKKVDFESNSLIRVENRIPELVPEFLVQVITNIEIKPSNIQMQSYLMRLGVRPISNIVDQTNYFMLLTGQPLHAYDYDKLKAIDSENDIPKIVIRKPTTDEKVELLSGKVVVPSPDTILIATNSKTLGLGGVMGGATTEIDQNSRNIILECATFDMYSIRRTAMENGIFSEAVTRFSKGQSKLQNIHILPEITDSIIKVAGGNADTSVVSGNQNQEVKQSVLVRPSFVNNLLGLDIDTEKMATLLTNVEIDVSGDEDGLKIEPPFWRTDLEIKEDVAEEIGRLYGYDKLNLVLPIRRATPAEKNKTLEFKSKLRDLMIRLGANETVTYSFVHGNLIEKVGQDSSLAYKLTSALSPDIQYYRMSLAPSLLEKIHPNIKAGFPRFVLYEMSKVVQRNFNDSVEKSLPEEFYRFAAVLVDQSESKAGYYQARFYLEYIARTLGVELTIQPFDEQNIDKKFAQTSKIFEPGRSAIVLSGNIFLGLIGEPKQSIKKQLKLPRYSSIIELDLDKLSYISKGDHYTKLSQYPAIDQDICYKVPLSVVYEDLYEMTLRIVQSKFSDIITLQPLDIFQGDDKQNKQITFRLTVNSYDKTLKNSDLSELMSSLKVQVASDFSGDII